MMSSRQQLLDTTDELLAIARAVRSLVPSWQRPEAFHEAKSDCVARINKLAAALQVRLPAPVLNSPVRTRTVEVLRLVHVERVVTLPARMRVRRRHRYPLPPTAGSPDLFDGWS
jgi:hypothetical protein